MSRNKYGFPLLCSLLLFLGSLCPVYAEEELFQYDSVPGPVITYDDEKNQSSSSYGENQTGKQTTDVSEDTGSSAALPGDVVPASVTGQKYEGTGTAVDYSEDASKVFYTIETADDKVFYLIIDKEKTSNNTYFLREINEDEMKLTVLVSPTPVPVPTETGSKKSSGVSAPLVGLVLLGSLGGAYYLIRKKSRENEEEYEENILPDPDDGSSGSEGYDPDYDPSANNDEQEDKYMLYSIPHLKSSQNTKIHQDQIVMYHYGPYGPHPDHIEIFHRSAT